VTTDSLFSGHPGALAQPVEGFSAFCHLLAHWTRATLVIALEAERTGVANVLSSNKALPVQTVDITQLLPPETTPEAAKVLLLCDRSSHLPSVLAVFLPKENPHLYFLPAGITEAENSGILLIGEASLATEMTRLPQPFITGVFQQMLRDHRSLQQKSFFRAKFKDIFDSVSVGIIVVESDSQSAMVNQVAAEILTLSPGTQQVAEVSQALRTLRERCSNREEIQQICITLSKDLHFSAKMDWVFPDRILFVDTHPILGNGTYGRVWILQDVSEQRGKEQRLQEEAEIDPLTKVYNRHYWAAYLLRFEQQQKASDHRSAVIMMDIDFFKHINDEYGHPAGDEVLRTVVERLRNRLRSRDGSLLMRWGGEEFLLILPVKHDTEARLVAERLREAVAAQPIRLDSLSIPVTISLGGTYYHAPESLSADTVARADKALYQAKQAGRNRCEWL